MYRGRSRRMAGRRDGRRDGRRVGRWDGQWDGRTQAVQILHKVGQTSNRCGFSRVSAPILPRPPCGGLVPADGVDFPLVVARRHQYSSAPTPNPPARTSRDILLTINKNKERDHLISTPTRFSWRASELLFLTFPLRCQLLSPVSKTVRGS